MFYAFLISLHEVVIIMIVECLSKLILMERAYLIIILFLFLIKLIFAWIVWNIFFFILIFLNLLSIF